MNIIPVNDPATALTFDTVALGIEPHTDTPSYVGYNLGDQETGLHPTGRWRSHRSDRRRH